MAKKNLRIGLPARLILLGLVLVALGALIASTPHLQAGAAPAGPGATPTPAPQPVSVAGSTDWIVLMGVIIVLIVILPIIFRRRTWAK